MSDLAEVSTELVMLDRASENLIRAIRHRADILAAAEGAKDLLAHHQGELVKAQRRLERMLEACPEAENGVREAFDLYRYAVERNDR